MDCLDFNLNFCLDLFEIDQTKLFAVFTAELVMHWTQYVN